MKRGMFVYPWNIPDDPSEFLAAYRDLGCDLIAVNSSYHHCCVPDLRLLRMRERTQAGTAFPVDPNRYGRLVPAMQEDKTRAYRALREACARTGVSFQCWSVNLHNSTLGEQFPALCVENAWGDRYCGALCLNQPDVREYARALTADTIDTLQPEAVVMEAISWMPALHGKHHEFSLAHITPAIRYLLSLCFCPACKENAARRGCDADEAKALVVRLLSDLLKRETTFGENEQTQLMNLFLEYPLLYQYQQLRMESVRVLLEETADAAHARGAGYQYIPSSTPFEVNNTYCEGISYRQAAPLVDGFVPLLYGARETFDACLANIRLFAPEVPVGLALNLGRERHADYGVFEAKVCGAARLGAQSLHYYNYGMATEEMLGWMRRANAQCI